MKKLTSFLLMVILLFSITAMSANAAIVLDDPAKKLDHIQVLVDKPAPGGVPATVASTSEPANVSVKSVTWSGNFDENGCFVEGGTYTATFNVAINDGADLKITDWYSYKFTVNGKEAKFAYSDDSLKNAVITYTFANLGAPHQNHCFCGGELTLGEHTEHEKHTYKPWKASGKIEYKDDIAYIYLTSDTTISETFRVPGGKIINLCLNGYTLKKSGGDRVINISSGGKLRLCDCSYMKTGKVLGGSHQMGGGIHNGGTFIMYGGKVMNNRASYGGGLWNNYNFAMYGGEICYNEAGYGGGVWNANSGDANFIIYGGKIYKNDANYGAGLWNNDNGNITMSGGEISGNVADKYGGGVWNQGKNFNMEGGWIRDNHALGGAGVWTQSFFTMTDGFISLNYAIDQAANPDQKKAYGGGVWVNDDSHFYMTGGQISLNKADSAGGGVWVNGGAEFVMHGGSLAGNTAQVGGGAYVQRADGKEGVFRLGGMAEVVDNNGTLSTGGIYVRGYFETSGGYVESNYSGSEFKDITLHPEGKAQKGTALPTQFTDVKADAYYCKPVIWAIEKGITKGTSNITFSPNEHCNLAQVITFLHRAAGSPEAKTSPPIADVYKGDYYYMAAYWGQSKGMFSTALYGNFSANRLSAVYFMWCAAGKPACKTPVKFTDMQDSQFDRYREAVAWAVEQGITNGTSATTFSPGKTCTRAEIVTFLHRYYGK